MAVTTSSPAPYAPPSAISDLIDRYRNRGLTTPFTKEVLGRAGVSDSLIPRTIQALQGLELIDAEGQPTETFESLRRAPEPDFKNQLTAWITAVYADVLSFVNPNDSETAIRDAFRAYNPVGQQPRMVALFIGLCRLAGMRTDEGAKESRPRPSARKPMPTPATPGRARQGRTEPAQQEASHVGLPAPISGLLRELPASREWTQWERDKFVKTFSAVLDFCYTVVASTRKSGEKEDDDD